MSVALRTAVIVALGAQVLIAGPALAKSIYVTGPCQCKKGNNLLATYSATICSAKKFHDACGDAKVACSTQSRAACTALGGKMFQFDTCSAGDKC
jgi:hypothetical protein